MRTSLAFRWFDGGLVPVAVRSSRRLSPGRLVPPAPVKRLANVVSTPVYDRLAWERGDVLDPGRGSPTTADVLAGILATAGAR